MSNPIGVCWEKTVYSKFPSRYVVLMEHVIILIPLFFGMGLVAAGFLATYCVYRYIVRAKDKSEYADLKLIYGATQFVAVATIWMLVFTVLLKTIDIVESLVPQVAIYGRTQGPSKPRIDKAHPPKTVRQPSKAE